MKYLVFIPIVTVFLAALFGVHYSIYLFITHFFAISATYKPFLLVGLALLSVSFFASSALGHWIDTAFSRAFYFISGLWMGTMLNIVLAMVATFAVIGLLRLTPFTFLNSFIAGIFLAGALVASIYGIWNALHPRIKNITVSIPQLPENWKGKKIVQISDVHLGHIFRAPYLQKVVNQINNENPDIVVITGDLFDGMDRGLPELVMPLNAIIAPKGILFTDGNHETYLGTQKTLEVVEQTKIHVLRDEAIDIDGLTFIGVMYPEYDEQENVVDVLRKLQPKFIGKPNVLLYHAPEMIADIAQMGINLQLSGHTHQGQQFPMQYITHFVHKGFDYGQYMIGDYTLYTTSGLGVWGPTMRIGTQSEIVVITLQ
jgi:predicted MPP superfamily phosphohydrolase